jgi:hypothetical protein
MTAATDGVDGGMYEVCADDLRAIAAWLAESENRAALIEAIGIDQDRTLPVLETAQATTLVAALRGEGETDG